MTEADYSGEWYHVTSTGETGSILADTTKSAAFTNTRTVGTLTLSKTVTGNGGDTTKPFDFTITLGGTGADGSYDYIGHGIPDGTIKSGETVSLAHGQSITIKDLPDGLTYEVTEADYSSEWYEMTSTGETGSIQTDTAKTAAFTNARTVGDLTISKTVTGNGGESTKPFDFTITLADTGADGSYAYIGHGVPDGTIKSGDTVSLTHGQSITIKDLPDGLTYEVKEADYSGEWYNVTSTGETGSIQTDTSKTAAFTNARTVGDLTISKTVTGKAGDLEKQFDFTITLAGTGADGSYDYIGHGVSDGTIKSGDTVSLTHDQSITIKDLPDGLTYEVTEADYSSEWYEMTSTGATGSILTDETHTAAFTNARTVGDLTISKTVTGKAGDLEKQFDFTITLTGTGADGSYAYIGHGIPDGTIKSGDTISLSHDQSITIKDLPDGLTYEVTEADYSGEWYKVTSLGETGNILTDETQSAAFTNARTVGDLTISKTVTGNAGDLEKQFDFTITLAGSGAARTYAYTGEGVPDGTIKSGDTISLSHDQSITIKDLPDGLTYKVTEADYSGEWYKVTSIGETGSILTDETQTAAFTNARTVGDLTISKTVDGNGGDPMKQFIFTIMLSGTGADGSYAYIGHGVPDGTVESGDTISLAHDQSITIKDLPDGLTYEVTEADYSGDGYLSTSTGATGSILTDETQSAAFTNTRTVGDLTISKTVTGEGADLTKKFNFTVTFIGTSEAYPYNGAATGTIKSGDTISLAHGEAITITGLPAGTQYTVTEADYTEAGYTSNSTGAEGTISADQLQTASFTNTLNSKPEEPGEPDKPGKPGDNGMPQTGDDQVGSLAKAGLIFFFIALVTLTAVDFNLRRKHGRSGKQK